MERRSLGTHPYFAGALVLALALGAVVSDSSLFPGNSLVLTVLYLCALVFQRGISGTEFYRRIELFRAPEDAPDEKDALVFCGSRVGSRQEGEDLRILAEVTGGSQRVHRLIARAVLVATYISCLWAFDSVEYRWTGPLHLLAAISVLASTSAGHFLAALAINAFAAGVTCFQGDGASGVWVVAYLVSVILVFRIFHSMQNEITTDERDDLLVPESMKKRWLRDSIFSAAGALALWSGAQALVPEGLWLEKPVEPPGKIGSKVDPKGSFWNGMEAKLSDLNRSSGKESAAVDQAGSAQKIAGEFGQSGEALREAAQALAGIAKVAGGLGNSVPSRGTPMEHLGQAESSGSDFGSEPKSGSAGAIQVAASEPELQKMIESSERLLNELERRSHEILESGESLESGVKHSDLAEVSGRVRELVSELKKSQPEADQRPLQGELKDWQPLVERAAKIAKEVEVEMAPIQESRPSASPTSSPKTNSGRVPESWIPRLVRILKALATLTGLLTLYLLFTRLLRRRVPEELETQKRLALEKARRDELRAALREIERRKTSAEQEVIQRYHLFLELMEALGLGRAAGEPASLYARRAGVFLPDLLGAMAGLTEGFCSVYYGQLKTDPRNLGAIRQAHRRICQRFM